MVEVINNYETLFIIDATLTDEEIEATVEKFKKMISDNGEITNVDVWGKRRLAYPINDMPEGYYVLINFTAKPEFPKELERVFKISGQVIRDLVIKK